MKVEANSIVSLEEVSVEEVVTHGVGHIASFLQIVVDGVHAAVVVFKQEADLPARRAVGSQDLARIIHIRI